MTKNEDMGVPGVFYHDRLYGKALYSIDINLNRDLSRFIANNGKHNVFSMQVDIFNTHQLNLKTKIGLWDGRFS